MQNTHSTPKWITVYLWMTTTMATVFSALAYLKPEVQFAAWPAYGANGALSLAGPLGLYIARNLATVATTVFALLSRSAVAICAALVLRAVTDGVDCLHNALAGNMPGAVFAGVMFALELTALLHLRNKA
jgi:hypothetical protein